jgi:hypothetical protein
VSRTYKDRESRYDDDGPKRKKKFPRVPRIEKRSEPFEDARKKQKYPEDWLDEINRVHDDYLDFPDLGVDPDDYPE